MEYLAVFTYIIFLIVKYDILKENNYKKTNYYLLLIIFILLSGLRYRVGGDTLVYMKYFESQVVPLSDLTIDSFKDVRYQPLCILLFSLSKSLGDNFFIFQLIASAIINIGIFFFFSKTTIKYFSAVLIYYVCNYLYFNTEVMREGMAISIILCGFLYLMKYKILKFYLFVFIAFLFHPFAIIMVIVPFFISTKIPIKVKAGFVIIVSTILFVVNLNDFIFFKLLPYIPISVITDTIDLYINNEAATESFFSFKGALVVFIPIPFLIYFFFISDTKKNSVMNIDKQFLYSILLIYILLVVLTLQMPIISRISNYFWAFSVIAFCVIIYSLKYKDLISNLICTIFIFSILTFWQVRIISHKTDSIPDYVKYYPYYSVFNKQEDSTREMAFEYVWRPY